MSEDRFYAASCADPAAMCAMGQRTMVRSSRSKSSGLRISSRYNNLRSSAAEAAAAPKLSPMPMILAAKPPADIPGKTCSYVAYPNVGPALEADGDQGMWSIRLHGTRWVGSYCAV